MTIEQHVRRIIITGAESTGTTTLAEALARHLGCEWIPEYGRQYTADRPGGPPAPWYHDEFRLIATRQNALEDEAAARSATGWLVCDTDSMATVLWEERYMGRSTEVVRDAANNHVAPFARILTGDEIPFEDDGQRDGEHIRHDMQDRFRQALAGPEGRGVPWIEVRGSVPDRLEATVRFLESLGAVK
ncbi:MAG: ATP-binding protein [Pseudomonadota bacterium]